MMILTIIMCVLFAVGMFILLQLIKKQTIANKSMDELVINFMKLSQEIYTVQTKQLKSYQATIDNLGKAIKDVSNQRVLMVKIDKTHDNLIDASKNIKEVSAIMKKTTNETTIVNTGMDVQKKMINALSGRVNEILKIVSKNK